MSSSKSCTTSWGCWKHPFGIPGVRPMFLKPKLHKESKNGFKTINYRPSPVMIFSKNCFWGKKIIKKLDILLSFEFLWQNIWINGTKFKKINSRTFRISWNITKIIKTEQFFHICLRSRKAYCSYNSKKTPDFQK